MRAIIFANGDLNHPLDQAKWRSDADLIVCADGGTAHAVRLGLTPHVVIGDMDSLPLTLRADLTQQGCQFIVHPPNKNETDLELALLYAVHQGASPIIIFGAFGRRLDHTLGNVLLLSHPQLAQSEVRMVGDAQEMCLVRRQADFQGAPGDLMSLLPLGGDALGIITEGLEYPLCDEPLYLGLTRGLSNVFLADRVRVSLRSGLLLAIHTAQTP